MVSLRPMMAQKMCLSIFPPLMPKGVKDLKEGEKVEFEIITNQKGPNAKNVVPLHKQEHFFGLMDIPLDNFGLMPYHKEGRGIFLAG